MLPQVLLEELKFPSHQTATFGIICGGEIEVLKRNPLIVASAYCLS